EDQERRRGEQPQQTLALSRVGRRDGHHLARRGERRLPAERLLVGSHRDTPCLDRTGRRRWHWRWAYTQRHARPDAIPILLLPVNWKVKAPLRPRPLGLSLGVIATQNRAAARRRSLPPATRAASPPSGRAARLPRPSPGKAAARTRTSLRPVLERLRPM